MPWKDYAISLIKIHEGYSGKLYWDTARPPRATIGYGWNISDCGIRESEAELRLSNDLNDISISLSELYPFFNKLNDPRKAAIADMAFNVGINKFSLFKNLIKFLSEADYERAADAMLNSLWALQVKGRAKHLAEIVRTGALEAL